MRSRTDDKSEGARSDEVIALHPAESGMQLGRALLHALHNAGISVLYQDREMKTVWARNMRAPRVSTPRTATASCRLRRSTASARQSATSSASGNPQRLEISVPLGGFRWFQVWVDADHGDGGTVQRCRHHHGRNNRQRRREQTLTTLLREVSHRSKNLLAIIQSIATQTGRYSDGIADFLTRFRGRLQSLASSQDLVTSSNWRGAALRELVSGQVGRNGVDPSHRLRFRGANP